MFMYRYGNQLLVTYNVSCPQFRSLYYKILEADLEPPNCPNR